VAALGLGDFADPLPERVGVLGLQFVDWPKALAIELAVRVTLALDVEARRVVLEHPLGAAHRVEAVIGRRRGDGVGEQDRSALHRLDKGGVDVTLDIGLLPLG